MEEWIKILMSVSFFREVEHLISLGRKDGMFQL